MPTDLTVFEQSTIAGVTLADETWREIRKLVDLNLSADQFVSRLREILETYEPLWAKTLSDGMLASWIEAQVATINKAKLTLVGTGRGPQAVGDFGPPTLPPIPPPAPAADEPPPIIRYPKIEAAVNDLVTRRILTAEEYYALSNRAKQFAFTVSKIGTEDALAKMRDLLAKDVEEGGTLAQFEKAVKQIEGASALSPARVELVYRNAVGHAHSVGQKRILQHPLVRSEFPYVVYDATHDSRVRPNHLAFEKWGIQGTAVYRIDDPLIQLYWPPYFHH